MTGASSSILKSRTMIRWIVVATWIVNALLLSRGLGVQAQGTNATCMAGFGWVSSSVLCLLILSGLIKSRPW